jgi:hypothetical protein
MHSVGTEDYRDVRFFAGNARSFIAVGVRARLARMASNSGRLWIS